MRSCPSEGYLGEIQWNIADFHFKPTKDESASTFPRSRQYKQGRQLFRNVLLAISRAVTLHSHGLTKINEQGQGVWLKVRWRYFLLS